MIETCSRLAVDRETLWAVISTMDGVNAELAPWLRMSVPAQAHGRRLDDVPMGDVAFDSWLLAFGFVPFDRHHLRLVAVEPGSGFLERSTSWLQRVWQHERTLVEIAGGTEICDRVTVEPKIGVLAPVVQQVARRVFGHRHERLRARFGVLA